MYSFPISRKLGDFSSNDFETIEDLWDDLLCFHMLLLFFAKAARVGCNVRI